MPESIADIELETRMLLGRYRVVKRLAEGGMGTVYLARTEGAEGFTRPVVVKLMKSSIRSDDAEKLFSREAKILSKMQHPGVLHIIDFGIEDGAYVMVLDYVHGYSLMQWLDYRFATRQPLPVELCIYITRRILSALHYAHHFDTEDGQNIAIVHRDVAPDNVLLSRKGHIRLLDFGIAKMHGAGVQATTKSGTFRGKLGYAAPETLEGKEATERADQYSTGVLLLEMLTLETPFAGSSMAESVQRMVNEVPPPVSQSRPEVPEGLDLVVARAIEKDPAARFDSVLDFSTALAQLQPLDDEASLRRLADILREDFEKLPGELLVESLKKLEEALERPLPEAPPPQYGSFSQPAQLPPTVRASLDSYHARSASQRPTLSAHPLSSRGVVIGAVIAAAGLALALGAVLAFRNKAARDDQQLVVFGSDNQATVAAIEGPGDAGSTAAATTAPAPELTPKEKLDAALKTQSASIQACFAQNLMAAETAPNAFLHFFVPKGGGHARVRVEPAGVANTPLGSCLAKAGGKVDFPAQEGSISFRVPVRAKVSRLHKD